jgi:hypothetical protein
MSLIFEMIAQEEKRILVMKNKYEQQLDTLPKGTLTLKKKGYYYLTYRDGKSVVSDYIGRYSEKVEKLKEQIERRKQIEKILKSLNLELELVMKVRRS